MPVSTVPEGSREEIYYRTGLRTTAGSKQPKATQRNPAKGNHKRADLCVSHAKHVIKFMRMRDFKKRNSNGLPPTKKKESTPAVGWISILSPSISLSHSLPLGHRRMKFSKQVAMATWRAQTRVGNCISLGDVAYSYRGSGDIHPK